MFVPKPLGKFIAIFRGEVSPVLILLSVALGFWFGVTPGWYGIHVALLVFALILNVHVGIFLMSAAIGKAFCYAAAPVLFYVGRWTQELLTPLLDFLAVLPVIGMTDFARYSVAGSSLVGPLLGLAGGLLLARSVSVFRHAWLTLEQNSDAFRKWHSNRWVRLLDRLLIGKRTQDVQAALKRRPKIIRLAGLGVAAVLVIASAVGLHFIRGERLTALAADALTKANGAEVNLAQLDLAVLSGRVSAKDIQFTDPANPANNRVAVGELTADASLWNLLHGKLVTDDIVLGNVEFDQPRAAAGRVSAAPPATKRAPFDPANFGLPMADVAKLESYFRNAEKIDEWCRKLAQWLPEGKDEAAPAPTPVPQHYLEYLTARALTPPTPRVLVRRALLDDVRLSPEQVGNSTITCTNLSDAPDAAGLPVTIAIESRERPTTVTIVCHYERPEGGAEINGSFADVDLRELQSELNPNNPVTLEGGVATANVAGTATARTIDLALEVQAEGLKARTTGSRLFDLDPQVTSEALRVLENIKTTLRLVGPTSEPRLVFDRPALTDEFKEALVRAGKHELAQRLDGLVGDQIPEGIPQPAQVVEDPLGAAQKGLSELLGGGKKKEDDKKKGDKEDRP